MSALLWLALLLLLPACCLASWMWWTLTDFNLEGLQLAEISAADWEA